MIQDSERYKQLVGDAILGIDTLWGGDVMCVSGTGRFIADSWFSDEPLPKAYTHPTADPVRKSGGVGADAPDKAAIEAYIGAVDVPGAISGLAEEARTLGGLRGAYLDGLVVCFAAMWDLAMEVIGKGEPVPFERCVRASTGQAPEPSEASALLSRVAELLGQSNDKPEALLAAVDAWRQARLVPGKSLKALGDAFIAQMEGLVARNVLPLLPEDLHGVPRANITFLPIEDAWFSGSMNYLGRERDEKGLPRYEATYELNAKLEISVPEFVQLVSHEVVPGHVTTFAYLQDLYRRGEVGFEATVLTMNTRGATLHEGLANNAILMAYGVSEVEDLPDDDLQIGVLLALLQDEAKNQAAYLTWGKDWPQPEVAATLRNDFLVSEERAQKLSGAWARHPLLGRMYLPAYRTGTHRVAELRRTRPAVAVIPAIYGCRGLVDIVTLEHVIGGPS